MSSQINQNLNDLDFDKCQFKGFSCKYNFIENEDSSTSFLKSKDYLIKLKTILKVDDCYSLANLK